MQKKNRKRTEKNQKEKESKENEFELQVLVIEQDNGMLMEGCLDIWFCDDASDNELMPETTNNNPQDNHNWMLVHFSWQIQLHVKSIAMLPVHLELWRMMTKMTTTTELKTMRTLQLNNETKTSPLQLPCWMWIKQFWLPNFKLTLQSHKIVSTMAV